jgi:hypothetical protein
MPVPSHNFTHLSIGAHGWELKETYNKHIIIFNYIMAIGQRKNRIGLIYFYIMHTTIVCHWFSQA